MTDQFHKPTQFSGDRFDEFEGGQDPAQISRVAHETANALLSRVRDDPDAAVVDRLVSLTDEHGVDAIAELWARASARSLPGALWRIYLMRILIRQDAEGISLLYQRGSEVLVTIDPIVAGVPSPTGPAEITALADQILRGLFTGDFAIALDRAAAFCRVTSTGAASLADDAEPVSPERATDFTRRALRLSQTASEFTACARLWRADALD
jgi:hypothetical protein